MAIQGTVIPVQFAPRTAPRNAPRAPARTVWALLKAMLQAHRTRRLLAEMDDHQLADIGIDRGQAYMEAARAPWDLTLRR
jgi:uncharacterized protein YjiS (DUF1127 family)